MLIFTGNACFFRVCFRNGMKLSPPELRPGLISVSGRMAILLSNCFFSILRAALPASCKYPHTAYFKMVGATY